MIVEDVSGWSRACRERMESLAMMRLRFARRHVERSLMALEAWTNHNLTLVAATSNFLELELDFCLEESQVSPQPHNFNSSITTGRANARNPDKYITLVHRIPENQQHSSQSTFARGAFSASLLCLLRRYTNSFLEITFLTRVEMAEEQNGSAAWPVADAGNLASYLLYRMSTNGLILRSSYPGNPRHRPTSLSLPPVEEGGQRGYKDSEPWYLRDHHSRSRYGPSRDPSSSSAFVRRQKRRLCVCSQQDSSRTCLRCLSCRHRCFDHHKRG